MAARNWPPKGLILTHGAGGDRDSHALVAIEEALAPIPVLRINFPYRDEGRKAPDRANKILPFLNAVATEFAAGCRAEPGEIALGGRSFGGRMCSMAVAEGLPAAGLVLLSYPLHPPGKPEKLRIEHFPDIDVPCLFISGDRDPFGTPTEFAEHTPTIGGAVDEVWIEGGAHDPKPAQDGAIADAVASWWRG